MDYLSATQTVTFADEEVSKTCDVIILDDGRLEGDETVNLTLSAPTGGAVIGSPGTAVLTIQDDGQDVIAADIDGSGAVDLGDLIMTLKILSNQTLQGEIYKGGDINGNGVIGPEEAVYILREVAGE